jgi:glycosyltransferase involved in cell wall biosynthesis
MAPIHRVSQLCRAAWTWDSSAPRQSLPQRAGAWALPADEFIVLQLGRLVPRKGIDNVVRAVAQLDASLKPRLLIVGGESRQPDEPARRRSRGCAPSHRGWVRATGSRSWAARPR